MDTYRIFLGLVLFMGGLGMMVLGVIYLNTLSTCSSSSPASTSICGTPIIAYLIVVIGVILTVAGAVFLAKARFAQSKSPYPRQYSRA